MSQGKYEYKYSNAFKYIDRQKWSDIEKQSIFEAWVPFIPNRPMPFFISDEFSDDGKPLLHNGMTGYLTDIIGDDSKSSIHYVLHTMKRRKVVILSSDDVCQNTTMPDLLVARIVSVKDYHREAIWYPNLLDGTHEWFVHLPEHVTGKESFINMMQAIPIGKNLLIEKYPSMLSSDKMRMIEERFAAGLALGVIKDIGDEDGIAINE